LSKGGKALQGHKTPLTVPSGPVGRIEKRARRAHGFGNAGERGSPQEGGGKRNCVWKNEELLGLFFSLDIKKPRKGKDFPKPLKARFTVLG